MNKYLYFCLIFICVSAFRCKQEGSTKTTDIDDNTITSDTAKISEHLMNVFYNLPSPKEVLDEVSEENALTYKNGLINSIDNYTKYNSIADKAINLGAYITDFSYLVVFQKNNQALKYISTIRNISHDLQIQGLDESEYINRIERNIQNLDSLAYYAEDIFYELSTILEKNGREWMVAIISIGDYIESVYISCNLVDDFDNQEMELQRIGEQKFLLDNLNGHIKKYGVPEYSTLAKNHVDKLEDAFSLFNTKLKDAKITGKEEGKLVISSDVTLTITRESFTEFTKRITILRNSVTHN